MREELQEQLLKDFPLLYEKVDRFNKILGFYFECGDGWYPLIRELSEKIYPLILKGREVDDEYDCYPQASQVKEKYGALRFYMTSETDEISELIRAYQDRSENTCEVCGKLGSIDYNEKWLSARCDEHR